MFSHCGPQNSGPDLKRWRSRRFRPEKSYSTCDKRRCRACAGDGGEVPVRGGGQNVHTRRAQPALPYRGADIGLRSYNSTTVARGYGDDPRMIQQRQEPDSPLIAGRRHQNHAAPRRVVAGVIQFMESRCVRGYYPKTEIDNPRAGVDSRYDRPRKFVWRYRSKPDTAPWVLGKDGIEDEGAGRTDGRGWRTSPGTEDPRNRCPVGTGFAAHILAEGQLIRLHGFHRQTEKGRMREIHRTIYDANRDRRIAASTDHWTGEIHEPKRIALATRRCAGGDPPARRWETEGRPASRAIPAAGVVPQSRDRLGTT